MVDSDLGPPAIRDKQLDAALRAVRRVKRHVEGHGLGGVERALLHSQAYSWKAPLRRWA